jgi:hypothetical protein
MALNILGDRWSLLMIRDLTVPGASGFGLADLGREAGENGGALRGD